MGARRVLTWTGLLAAAVGIAGSRPVRRRMIADTLGLPPATHDHRVERGLRVATDTPGITLATDVYHPVGEPPGPTVLIRTPYSRTLPVGVLWTFEARRFAERGYRVVVQDVRGRFDSDGHPFVPYIHERADGAATARWIVGQPWSDGRIATWGASYHGYTQWALAASDGPSPAAMVPVITSADLGSPTRDGALPLGAVVRWMVTVDAMENADLPWRERVGRVAVPGVQRRRFASAYTHLPLESADEAVLGERSSIWRLWADHPDAADPLWRDIDHGDAVAAVTAPVHHVSGWFDVFVERQLRDYRRQVEAGARPYLTVGPWSHLDMRLARASLRQAIDWFDTHLRGAQGRLRASPVRLWVSGADEWRDMEVWPPATANESWATTDDGRLTPLDGDPRTTAQAAGGGGAGGVTSYHYDPADPTPALGGALLSIEAGQVDNRPVEARDDVLTFTSPVLTAPKEVMGAAVARLCVSATAPDVDLVVRLCDVQPDGRSLNLADGYRRLVPGDWETAGPQPAERGGVGHAARAGAGGRTTGGQHGGGSPTGDGEAVAAGQPSPVGPVAVEVPTFPLAHRFMPGHRIRIAVSSAAHPRVARNLGTGEPPMAATAMQPVDVTLYHGGDSALRLPVVTDPDG